MRGAIIAGRRRGPTPPAAAVAAGYNTLVFNSDFINANEVATTGTQTTDATHKWFWSFGVGVQITSGSWTVNTAGTATGTGASPQGGILTINAIRGGTAGRWGESVLISTPGRTISGGVVPAGTSWQFGYYETYVHFDRIGSFSGDLNDGWQGFWAWGVENLNGFGFGGSGLSATVTEVDIMEYDGGLFGWGAAQDNKVNIHNPAASTLVASSSYPDADSNWHKVGLLWTPGHVSTYWDDVIKLNNVSSASWALDGTHLFLILTGGIAWPISFDWVRVWQ